MHELDAFAENFSHTTVYAQLIITCNGPKIRMCANIENTAITTHHYGHIILTVLDSMHKNA